MFNINKKIELLKAFLLSVVVFLFLFYVAWSIPITILARAFNISDYFIINNFFVLLSLGITILLFILQMIFIFCNKKIYNRIIYCSLFFLVITFLYPLVLPYNYGSFIDNVTLTSARSLTDFSPLYYLLDFILIGFSIFLVKIIVIKKQSIGLLLFFLVFYSVENTIKYSSIDLSSGYNVKYLSGTIPISENHQNVLLFILDSVSPPFMMDSLDNYWSAEEKEWVKDFTYYDNTTALSLGATLVSLPNMIGGYQFSPQEHINTIVSSNIKFYNINRSRFKYFEDPTYFFSEQAVQTLKQEVLNKAEVSYAYLSEPVFYSPIISVSAYKFIPYFMKSILAEGNQWKHRFSYRFFSVYNILEKIKKEYSDRGFIHIIHNDGTHTPVFSRGGNPAIEVSQKLSRSMEIIRSIIKQLKESNVYDNTKIIVASDHGYNCINKDFIKTISSKGLEPFYMENMAQIDTLPSLLMVKDFNQRNNKMKIDSRFLSLADISGMMKSPFLSNSVDYTKINPPKRIFNIPWVDWGNIYTIMQGRDLQKPRLSNGNIVIVQVESIKKGLFTTNNYSLSNIIDLPAYTVIP